MKIKMILLTIILALSAIISCTSNTEPPVIEPNTLKLTLIDVSVTEAYLHIDIGSIRNDEDIVLLRDGKEVLSFKNTRKDTIVTDTSLTENTAYSYTVVGRMNGKESGKSNEVAVTTLQPTSHNFTWETYTFGDNNYSSYNAFSDIAIINENDIWAVGEIYLKDTLGIEDDKLYGAAHWDGNQWKFYQVPVRSYPTVPAWPNVIIAIHTIGNNVYVSGGTDLIKYKDGRWIEMAVFNQGENFNGVVREIWGKDESNIYCAGYYGSIYHVSSNRWSKLPYQSQYTVMDIWGYTNPLTGKDEIYCPLYDTYNTYKSKLLKITDSDKINEISWMEDEKLSAIWTNKGFPIFAGGKKLFSNNKRNWEEISLENIVNVSCIKGTNLNNIAAAGVRSIVHYNGKDWQVYDAGRSVFYSIDVKENIIAAAGYDGNKAVVVIGRR